MAACSAGAGPTEAGRKAKSPARRLGFLLEIPWWPGTESNRRHADFQSICMSPNISGLRENASTNHSFRSGYNPRPSWAWDRIVEALGALVSTRIGTSAYNLANQ